MPTAAREFRLEGFEQTDAPVMARVYKNGTLITQAGISTIAVTVKRYNKATGGVTETLSDQSVSVSSAVYDTLQTDAKWDQDSIGYNFAYVVPQAAFPGPDSYAIVLTFTPTSGNPFRLAIRYNAISLQGAI